MMAKIAEIVPLIQGEGLYVGQPQVFVRFFGCNLNCRFCDTPLRSFTEYEPEAVCQQLRRYAQSHEYVSFTGGEPLLQKDFLKVTMAFARNAGFKNYLETNGTLPDALSEVIDEVDVVAMDVKLPSSTGLGHFWDSHRQFLRVASRKEVFVKTIICSTTHSDDVQACLQVIKEADPSAVLVFQPNSAEERSTLEKPLRSFQEQSEQAGVTSCVIPQLHKMMGLR